MGTVLSFIDRVRVRTSKAIEFGKVLKRVSYRKSIKGLLRLSLCVLYGKTRRRKFVVTWAKATSSRRRKPSMRKALLTNADTHQNTGLLTFTQPEHQDREHRTGLPLAMITCPADNSRNRYPGGSSSCTKSKISDHYTALLFS